MLIRPGGGGGGGAGMLLDNELEAVLPNKPFGIGGGGGGGGPPLLCGGAGGLFCDCLKKRPSFLRKIWNFFKFFK